jgi:hypothetical protein
MLFGKPVKHCSYGLFERPFGFDKYLGNPSPYTFPNQFYGIEFWGIRR